MLKFSFHQKIYVIRLLNIFSVKTAILISLLFVQLNLFIAIANGATTQKDLPPAGSDPLKPGSNSNPYRLGNDIYKIFRGDGATRSILVSFHNDIATAFPDLVPRLREVGNHSMVQDYVGGFSFEELKGEAKIRAIDAMDEIVGKADRVMGQTWVGEPLARGTILSLPENVRVVIDSNPSNFRFYDNGTPYKWFDPIFITSPTTQHLGSYPTYSPVKLLSPPLSQVPGAVSVTSVSGQVAAKVGLPVLLADYFGGLSLATDPLTYTGDYITNFGLALGGLKFAEVAGLTLLRASIGAAATAALAPWVGTGVVVSLTGFGIYHTYNTFWGPWGVFSGGSKDSLSTVDMGKIGTLASKTNGCLGQCAHNMVGNQAALFAKGAEIQQLLSYGKLTESQANALLLEVQKYESEVNAHTAQVQSAKASGLKVPNPTRLQQQVAAVKNGVFIMNSRPRVADDFKRERAPIWSNPVTTMMFKNDGTALKTQSPKSDWVARTGNGDGGYTTYEEYFDDKGQQQFKVTYHKNSIAPKKDLSGVVKVEFNESLYMYGDGHLEIGPPISTDEMGGLGFEWGDGAVQSLDSGVMFVKTPEPDSFQSAYIDPNIVKANESAIEPQTIGINGSFMGFTYSGWTGYGVGTVIGRFGDGVNGRYSCLLACPRAK